MALGSTLPNTALPTVQGAVLPVSLTSNWIQVLDANGPATLNNATITNPTTQITTSTTHPLSTQGVGTLLVLRLVYDAGLTSITNPTVKVFGKSGASAWSLLQTKAGALNAAITTASTDVSDGTFKYTTPDLTNIAWDMQGCDTILVGVEVALAGTGTVSNSLIQAKII